MIKLTKHDMFADTQQTPVKAPSTPSMTPVRSSVKRRSEMKRPPIPQTLPRREAALGVSKSQPAQLEDFYDLRTRQVPLSCSMNERKTSNKGQLVFYVTGIFTLMVISAFLGAMCYAHFQHLYVPTGHCPPLQIAQDTEIDRSVDSNHHHLESSVLRLSEEIIYIKDHLSKLWANVGSTQVNSSPQKGILEELLTPDLACSGNRGTVLATPDTSTVTVPATVTLLGIFSFNIDVNQRHPHTTIEGLITEVGDCWAFKGSQGRLVLRLHRRSLVTGVSISHLPPSVSGDVSSAPRLFQVLAHDKDEDLQNGRVLGEFEYKTSGTWRQTFPLDSSASDKTENLIEFRFLKNHGNPNCTCVYRVHVHGTTPEL